DTGATSSVIQPAIAKSLGLQPVGIVNISTPSSPTSIKLSSAASLFEDSGPGRKVAVLDQNRWPLSTGISGHFEPESLAGFDQNMQINGRMGSKSLKGEFLSILR
ncbi:MAG: retropepsin-like domain-containing protein, partial [Candidatus Aminicenantes bacterium]|nr:retropepsin-like domain-containing protein [Candidatus Aminicenantes bacterium]